MKSLSYGLRKTISRRLALLAVASSLSIASIGYSQDMMMAHREVGYESHIVPILESKCYKCHGPDKQKGALRLDSPHSIVTGGETGGVVEPGNPDDSSLYFLTTYPDDDPDYMPQKGQGLTEDEKQLLFDWILRGASFGNEHPSFSEIASGSAPAKPKAKYGEGSYSGTYELDTSISALVAELEESDIIFDTVNHDASRYEVSFTYAEEIDFSQMEPVAGAVMRLVFARSKVTDSDLSNLGVFENLEVLDLSRTSISDAGLANLAGLENLKRINLRDTSITDKGLEALFGLKSLESIHLWGTDVSSSGVKKLQRAIPSAAINSGSRIAPPPRPQSGDRV